jgi:rubrerythrin
VFKINKYICPSCRTKWNVNKLNGLLPEVYGATGYWSNKDTNPQNCPECEHRTSEYLPVWLWVSTIME